MTISKDEKAIIAAFKTMDDAKKVKQQLDQLGIIDQRIDRISEYTITDLDERLHNPITGDFPGLASAVYASDMDRDSSILASVQPSASGLSDGGNQEDIGYDVVLTVVVSEQKFDQAEKIVRENGGRF